MRVGVGIRFGPRMTWKEPGSMSNFDKDLPENGEKFISELSCLLLAYLLDKC